VPPTLEQRTDGVGGLDDAGLARAVNNALGTSFRCLQPQLAVVKSGVAHRHDAKRRH